MALEAGRLMHDVFAAVRIWQLEHRQRLERHAKVTAERIFGSRRWASCVKNVKAKDDRDNLLELCFNVLHTAGWENDPKDKNRTMANFELSTIDYVDERLGHMDNWPIYVENGRDPYSMVGIEQVFDVVVEFADGALIRYIGTVDGLVIKLPQKIHCLDENKSANRLGDGWRAGFEMSHQITGYCAAGSVVFGFPIEHSRVTGVKIGRGEDPYTLEPIARDAEFVANWASWLYHTARIFETFKDNYEGAQRYTHSCSRYYRPCSLIPFCSDTVEGRRAQWQSMIPNDLSPSEEAILDS